MTPARATEARNVLDSIKQILTILGISWDSIEDLSTPHAISFNIKTQESGLLIGGNGETISALNHIIKRMAAYGEESLKISVDVNGYLESNNQTIRNKTFVLAERARSFKTDVEMEPMSSYERMVVHSFLASDPHLETRSIGDGKNRRVVISYTEKKKEA